MRKSNIILGLIVSLCVFHAKATEKKIKQGNFRTGSFLNIGRTLSSDSSAEILLIDVRGDLNYFIMDKLSLGPIIRYNYREQSGSLLGPDKQDEFTFGFNSNLYFYESEAWVLLTGLGVLTKVNDEEIIYNIHLGAEYFINETISVGPKLIYQNVNAEDGSGSNDSISFFTGFYFYL